MVRFLSDPPVYFAAWVFVAALSSFLAQLAYFGLAPEATAEAYATEGRMTVYDLALVEAPPAGGRDPRAVRVLCELRARLRAWVHSKAAVREGEKMTFDITNRILSVDLLDSEIEEHLKDWTDPLPRYETGSSPTSKYAALVGSAAEGAVNRPGANGAHG